MQTGIYGKHPAFGDFITTGLPDDAQEMVERWLHKVLPGLRDMWGDNWQVFFDAAPVINFWFGPALTHGSGSLCGMMGPSRDKVGRRFPLLAAVSGSGQMPPPVDAGQDLYAGLFQIIAGYARAENTGASEFGAGLATAAEPLLTPADDGYADSFWAVRQDGDTARLWQDVAEADHFRGAATRSYLWCAGAAGAAVHVCEGLPAAAEMAWLMTSATATPLPEEQNEQELPEPEVTE